MLKPGGRLLDVGMQSGRAAMFFALHGMRVTVYDTEPRWIEHVQELATSGLPELQWEVHQQDFLEADVEPESMDTILFAQTFLHMPDKQTTIQMMDKAWTALKPGGVVWVRACGKMDSNYWELLYESNGWRYPEIRKIDDDVIEHPCDCSGEERIDPTLFFEQMDLLNYFSVHKGARIVHNQMIPGKERHNIMFGEDFNRGNANSYLTGNVTILAQKPVSETASNTPDHATVAEDL